MYTFSLISYIETVIVLSCNSSTQETQIIIELLTMYIVHANTRYCCMITVPMYVIALEINPPNPVQHTTLLSCLLKDPFLDVIS